MLLLKANGTKVDWTTHEDLQTNYFLCLKLYFNGNADTCHTDLQQLWNEQRPFNKCLSDSLLSSAALSLTQVTLGLIIVDICLRFAPLTLEKKNPKKRYKSSTARYFTNATQSIFAWEFCKQTIKIRVNCHRSPLAEGKWKEPGNSGE